MLQSSNKCALRVCSHVTVSILDDDQPLAISSTTTASVAENTPNSTVILVVKTADPTDQGLIFALSGSDATDFTINSSTGEISFPTSPDFETTADQGGDNVYNVTVTATDSFIPDSVGFTGSDDHRHSRE